LLLVCALLLLLISTQLTLRATLYSLLLSLLHYTYLHTSQSQDGVGDGISKHDATSNTLTTGNAVVGGNTNGETLASKDSTAGIKDSTTEQLCDQ
jgi:hypothetical protein